MSQGRRHRRNRRLYHSGRSHIVRSNETCHWRSRNEFTLCPATCEFDACFMLRSARTAVYAAAHRHGVFRSRRNFHAASTRSENRTLPVWAHCGHPTLSVGLVSSSNVFNGGSADKADWSPLQHLGALREIHLSSCCRVSIEDQDRTQLALNILDQLPE